MSFSDYQISAFKKLEPLLKKYGVTVNEGNFPGAKDVKMPGKENNYNKYHSQLEALADSGKINTPQGKQMADKLITAIEKEFPNEIAPSRSVWLSEQGMAEAKYHGREVPLGKPMKGDVKKSKVYVRDPATGNIKKVNFGDPNMRIKKSNPARRKSFRARHHCANPGPRTKARYWSCRAW
jgi:hypothetical protein